MNVLILVVTLLLFPLTRLSSELAMVPADPQVISTHVASFVDKLEAWALVASMILATVVTVLTVVGHAIEAFHPAPGSRWDRAAKVCLALAVNFRGVVNAIRGEPAPEVKRTEESEEAPEKAPLGPDGEVLYLQPVWPRDVGLDLSSAQQQVLPPPLTPTPASASASASETSAWGALISPPVDHIANVEPPPPPSEVSTATEPMTVDLNPSSSSPSPSPSAELHEAPTPIPDEVLYADRRPAIEPAVKPPPPPSAPHGKPATSPGAPSAPSNTSAVPAPGVSITTPTQTRQ